jgi:hypothetical protein
MAVSTREGDRAAGRSNLAVVRRTALLLVIVALAAACDSGAVTTSTSSGVTIASTTTTTMDVAACEEVTADAVAWVEELVAALDGVTYDQLVDRTQWPEALDALDTRGNELQERSDAAGCDEGLIRGAVVAAASEMEAGSSTGRLLLELIAPSP